VKRALILVSLTLLALCAAVACLDVFSTPAELPPPDPTLAITLEDGSQVPLAELLERTRTATIPAQETPAPTPAPQVGDDHDGAWQKLAAARAAPPDPRVLQANRERVQAQLDQRHPLHLLAMQREREGDLDQALALLQSIPEDHPDWAWAQRHIGWRILAQGKGDPAGGLPYVQRALRADPLDGNAWQDAARVHAATLGFDLD